MRRRLNTRCAGLIEVFSDCDSHPNQILDYQVDFLGRTVRDFLLGQDIQEMLASRTQFPFSTRAYLCRAPLTQIKLIVGLMTYHDMNAHEMEDNRTYFFDDDNIMR